ncbi:MAG: cell division topological specificity factor MinE [Rhodospirillales bacterium]|jgi:cell division topological specificity factor|nr:cell division topological specificity factor MinE [Rhodospirillales bacterium]
MSIFDFFRPRGQPSATAAKERLQILLAHERSTAAAPDYLPKLQREIIDLVTKYVQVADDKISVHYANAGSVSTLEVNVELPVMEPAAPMRRSFG